MPTLSSLPAPEDVMMTTSGASSDDKVGFMTTNIFSVHHNDPGLSPLIYTLKPSQNGRLFADDMCICFFLNENVLISINISLIFFNEIAWIPINISL